MRAASATVSSSTVPAAHTFRARPRSTSSGASTQSDVNSTCAARCQPMSGGEQHAAGRLGGHAQFGEGHAQAGPGVDEDEVAVGEEGEAQADGDTVDRGEQRDRQVDEAVQQPHEALPGSLDGGPGGDGRHFGQVLPGREGRAPAGHHDGPDGLVAVRGAQGGGHLVVHRRVEGVADVGPVEGDDADAGCGLLDLDARHAIQPPCASAAAARRRMMVSAAPLIPVEMGQPT